MLLLALPTTVVAGTAAANGTSSTGTRTWQTEQPENPGSAEISALAAVACVSSNACTAVGSSSRTLSTPTRTLAERWNGKAWRIQSIPTPKGTSDTLYGVSCPSARVCVATGNAYRRGNGRTTTLAEMWNGRRWRVQATPNYKRTPTLYAVSCGSPSSCIAAGSTQDGAGNAQALVERWNGSRWRILAVPRPALRTQFQGVACTKAHWCMAVGSRAGTGNARPFAESWNGRKWEVHAPPAPIAGVFSAVSCTSPNQCMATGTNFATGGTALAEKWNGKTWRVETTPNPANYTASFAGVNLDGVSCTSADACTASGDYAPGGAAAYFVESWNGTSWQMENSPTPPDFLHGALLAISCVSVRCTAVGAYASPFRLQVTLAMSG